VAPPCSPSPASTGLPWRRISKRLAEAVEAFRKAMIASDHAAFDALCAAQLSCGHSGGKIQTKEEFIADATSQKAKWHALDDRLALGRAFLAGPCIIARCYV
jgi:Domain of unknown function (DUF4440)